MNIMVGWLGIDVERSDLGRLSIPCRALTTAPHPVRRLGRGSFLGVDCLAGLRSFGTTHSADHATSDSTTIADRRNQMPVVCVFSWVLF